MCPNVFYAPSNFYTVHPRDPSLGDVPLVSGRAPNQHNNYHNDTRLSVSCVTQPTAKVYEPKALCNKED